MIVKPLSPEVEYQKNSDIKKEDITQLSEWMDRQPHLPKLSELELILFYHSCNSSTELTKKTIDLNYTMKTHWNEFFTDYDPKSPKNVHTLETLLLMKLPGVTKEGYEVYYCRLMDYEPSNFFLENAAKIFVLVNELSQAQDGTFPGVVIVLDMDGVVLGHVARLGLIAIKKILQYLQEAMPVRLRGFHFMNAPTFMDKILALIKPFMNKELSGFLHVHPPPIDSIYEFVPKENFPKEISGNGATFEKNRCDVQKWLESNRDYLMEREKIRVNESKRPSKPKYIGEITGIEGSFKKLDID